MLGDEATVAHCRVYCSAQGQFLDVRRNIRFLPTLKVLTVQLIEAREYFQYESVEVFDMSVLGKVQRCLDRLLLVIYDLVEYVVVETECLELGGVVLLKSFEDLWEMCDLVKADVQVSE